MANILFLRLEGPLQSWGERARWSVRDTAPQPTKSGVVGLLGCALGLKEDADLRNLSQHIHIGVRSDQPGRVMADYHTVVGGVMSAEGKIKINANTHQPETVVSWRYYLCDASFLVALQALPELVEHLALAVQYPHWPIYLGRKCCPPSQPIYAGVGEFPSLQMALNAWPLFRSDRIDGEKRLVPASIECLPGSGVRRMDEVGSNSRRTFLPRYTQELGLNLEAIIEEE